MRKLANALIVLCSISGSTLWALDLALPQSAQQVSTATTAPDRYNLPIGTYNGKAVPIEPVEGTVTREVWRVDSASITNLQLIQPIRETLAQAGYEIVLDCADAACGGFAFRFNIEVVPPPDMYLNLNDFHVLSARHPEGAINVLISGTSVTRFLQIIHVAQSPGSGLETSPTTIFGVQRPVPRASDPRPTGGLTAALEHDGRVVLDDLTFETGSSTLTTGSYASLRALASYLIENPSRQVALVGHTDAEGSLEGNMALSLRRAQSVQTRMVETYGANADQLDASGMGYLAPRTTNLTPEGRAANRRVEAVLTSTK
ncbi:MAG: OmpA family protein [Marinovum sp.]|nr:OmpA family protein [Marinovum sp.]